jgi:hypothetical protein
MVKPEELTEAAIVEAICEREPSHYQDFGDFAQDCHSVSLALVRSGLLGKGGPRLRVARGACLGVGGQHSWVVLGDPYNSRAKIVDITLWSYDTSKPRIWIGNMEDRLHRPKGFDWIFNTTKPYYRGGDKIVLEEAGLSIEARRFLHVLGPLDAAGWATLWSHGGMLGWPAKEILEACLDQHPTMSALVPIDIIGMTTNRNPDGLYW